MLKAAIRSQATPSTFCLKISLARSLSSWGTLNWTCYHQQTGYWVFSYFITRVCFFQFWITVASLSFKALQEFLKDHQTSARFSKHLRHSLTLLKVLPAPVHCHFQGYAHIFRACYGSTPLPGTRIYSSYFVVKQVTPKLSGLKQ